MKRVLSLCDFTGNMVKPWADAGYQCDCIDVLNDNRLGNNTHFIKSDIFDWRPQKGYSIVFAFPPCTHLAVSGARWFKGKGLRKLSEAILLVARCAEICNEIGAPWMIENPVSTLSTYWRQPDYQFDPCDYAGYLDDLNEDAYTKRTCLWIGNGFVVPGFKRVAPIIGGRDEMIRHRTGGHHPSFESQECKNLRSATPRGFAQAVFEANHENL